MDADWQTAVVTALGVSSARWQAVGGGVWRLTTAAGSVAVKRIVAPAATSAARLAGEVAGLQALAATGTVRVPTVLAQGADWLATQWLERDAAPAWEQLGRELAALHAVPQAACGFAVITHCGATPQDNRPASDAAADDAVAWFGQRRLLALADLGERRRVWSSNVLAAVTRLVAQLPELVPPQRPALCHGDLWVGNALATASGGPVLIDPAAACGPAEAELAMTALFGGFPDEFYDAYIEASADLAADWRQRMDIYQLFHLLNHWLLFGGSYADDSRTILRRYGVL